MSGAGETAPFFVPCGFFLIPHDSKCSRPISVVRWVVQSVRSVRRRPRSRDGVCDGVFVDDFGK